jgi:hypothetical protein
VLAKLAERFTNLWQRIDHWPDTEVCTQIVGDQLIFTLSTALSDEQRALAATDVGYAGVLRDLTRSLDRIYSPLADAIERNLHCYVGAMQVDLEPDEGQILVQFHLREAPGLWRIAQPESSCL